VGEQSNAYRILLRYDRKSRHRRIKKQRRYERLAATSQFRDTSGPPDGGSLGRFSTPCGSVDGRALSSGRSPYLRRAMEGHAHTFASVEPPSYDQGARSAADRLYPLNFYPSAQTDSEQMYCIRAWYQRPYESFPHPGMLPDLVSTFTTSVRLDSVGTEPGTN
jgi:hypothetical protein